MPIDTPTTTIRTILIPPSIAFFFSGLFNNFSYVIMLSASKSILPNDAVSLVLLFDDLPGFLAQIASPLLLRFVSYRLRILIIATCTVSSLCLGAACVSGHCRSYPIFLPLLSVSLTSIAFGIGESTFFSMLSVHPPTSVGWFSSGTGASGVVGAGAYYVLIHFFYSSVALLLCVLLVPIHVFIFLKVVLPMTKDRQCLTRLPTSSLAASAASTTTSNVGTLRKEWRVVLAYFAPLFSMYVITFTMNHTLVPMAVATEAEYVWVYWMYQCAVFASRSALSWLSLKRIRHVWWLVIVQSCLCYVLWLNLSEAGIGNGPSGSKVLLAVTALIGGAISGTIYVNIFHMLRTDRRLHVKSREVVMGLVVTATTAGPIFSALMGIALYSKLEKSW
jgi:battenin